jgi:hypothetical protein
MKKKIIYATVFAISMGLLESAIVIYLRALFYPEGFAFPLKSMPSYLITTELAREAATIFMLIAVAWFCGSRPTLRFVWFIYLFAIWDIFYYVFLKLILNWPESWFTWDVLFLIPCLWVGPVLAPVILCIWMILLWGIVLYFETKSSLKFDKLDYVLLILGAFSLIINFCWDNAMYFLEAKNDEALSVLHLSYIPQTFNWWVFAISNAIVLLAIFRVWINSQHSLKCLKEGQLF